jgi:hypothetical protein
MTTGDWIQLIAALAAVSAAVSALWIAHKDRRTQMEIAKRDRELARLSTELEYAVRLSANRNMGGSQDSAESKRLGAEALALAAVVGRRWVPTQFEHATSGLTAGEMAAKLSDDEKVTPQWVKWKIESGLAVQRIIDEMYR